MTFSGAVGLTKPLIGGIVLGFVLVCTAGIPRTSFTYKRIYRKSKA
jgi:hypothetical protein